MVSDLDIFINKHEFWKKRIGIKLTDLTSQSEIDKVVAVLHDTHDMDEVREYAGACLGHIGTNYTVDILEYALKFSAEYKTRLFCLIGLQVSSHSRVNNILLERLIDENEDGRIRQSACYALANRQYTDVIPYAIQYIDASFMSEDTFIGANMAVESLLKFKTPVTMDAIIEWSMMALADEARLILQRERAANYLMLHGDDRCEVLMINMIDNPAVYSKRLYAGKSGNHAVETLKRLNTLDGKVAIQAWQHSNK